MARKRGSSEGNGKRPAFQQYPRDYLGDPQLSLCSPATRAIWSDAYNSIEQLVQSRGGAPFLHGTVPALARICRCTEEQMMAAVAEIAQTGTGDVLINGRPYPPGVQTQIQTAVAKYLAEVTLEAAAAVADGYYLDEPASIDVGKPAVEAPSPQLELLAGPGGNAEENPAENLRSNAPVTRSLRESYDLRNAPSGIFVTVVCRRVYRKYKDNWSARLRVARWRAKKADAERPKT